MWNSTTTGNVYLGESSKMSSWVQLLAPSLFAPVHSEENARPQRSAGHCRSGEAQSQGLEEARCDLLGSRNLKGSQPLLGSPTLSMSLGTKERCRDLWLLAPVKKQYLPFSLLCRPARLISSCTLCQLSAGRCRVFLEHPNPFKAGAWGSEGSPH